MQYDRNDYNFTRGKFRVRGDTVELCPAYTEDAVRVEFFGDEIERITRIEPFTGDSIEELENMPIFAARHYVTPADKMRRAQQTIRMELEDRIAQLEKEGKLLEAQRLKMRTTFDLEMMEEMGFCNGIENYSRHTSGRPAGSRPFTLIDFFPRDMLTIIDESHVAVPQIGGMYEGDRSRKTVLVEHGFRLPSALDNRPLKFDEFDELIGQRLYVSATPSKYEVQKAGGVTAEQVIRPTGLLDPEIVIKPLAGQIDDLIEQGEAARGKGRARAGDHADQAHGGGPDRLPARGRPEGALHPLGDRHDRARGNPAQPAHWARSMCLSASTCCARGSICRRSRSSPCSMRTRKDFLRSQTSLIQTAGRAARHQNGLVILYADVMTDSIKELLAVSKDRREKQIAYNTEHGITPTTIIRAVQESLGSLLKGRQMAGAVVGESSKDMDVMTVLQELEQEMFAASNSLAYEKAALLRDQIMELKQQAGLTKIEPRGGQPQAYPKGGKRGRKAAKI